MRAFPLLLLLAAAAACTPLPAPPPAASRTPAERALGEWLAAYNAGDSAALAAYIQRSYAPGLLARRDAATRARSLGGWWKNYGAMRLVRVDSASAGAVVATVWEAVPRAWGRLYLDVDTLAPHAVTGVGLEPMVEPPDWSRVPTVADSALTRELGGFVDALTRAGLFSGVVLVVREGETVFAHAGPDPVEAAFELASVGKMFTGVAVAQLAQRGLLSFSDPVARLLPDYPGAGAGRMTVHHLLTHTAGLPDLFGNPRYRAMRDSVRTLPEHWPFFAMDSLEFEPGTRWAYSNSNFILLGAIVERVSGQPFGAYVQEHVLNPAGMARTRPGGPAGGGVSTASDLVRFAEALLAHRLLDAGTTAQVLAGHAAAEYGGMDGYGFETRTWNGVRFVGHGGAFPGLSNQVDVYPAQGYTVVVLSTSDGSGAQAIANRMRVLLAARGGPATTAGGR
jgi:D-alanyl-D-alanine carboxypeptidase